MFRNFVLDVIYLMFYLFSLTSIWLIVSTSCQLLSDSEPGRPDACVGSGALLNRFCCALPPFFTRDIAKECGGEGVRISSVQNYTASRRYDARGCNYWICILTKYDLTISKNGDKYVDHDAYFKHLDLWASLNPSFINIMLDAKIYCKQGYRMFMPFKICEFHTFNKCIRNYLRVECPITFPTKECDEQKRFFKLCGKYFYK